MQKRGRTVFRPFFFLRMVGGTFSNNRLFVSVNVVLFLVSDSCIMCRVSSSICIVANANTITAAIEGDSTIRDSRLGLFKTIVYFVMTFIT